MAFEVLIALISLFELSEIGEFNLNELFVILISNIPSTKVVSKGGQENYAKHLIFFIGKFIHKFGTSCWLSHFEMNHKGITEKFINRDFESVFELESIAKKKVVTYGLCRLMVENYSNFGREFTKFLTTQMIDLLERFHKSSSNYSFNDNVLTLNDTCNFQANGVNKLLNTDIKVNSSS